MKKFLIAACLMLNFSANAHSSGILPQNQIQIPNEFIGYWNCCSERFSFVIKELIDFLKDYNSLRTEILDDDILERRNQKLEAIFQVKYQIAQVTNQYSNDIQHFIYQLGQETNNIDALEDQLHQLNDAAYDCAEKIVHGIVEIYDIYGEENLF